MAGDVSLFLAVDGANSIRTASADDLKRWNIDTEAACRRAVVNIKARIGPLNMIRLGGGDGPSGIGAAGGIAPSLLADPTFCGPGAPTGRPPGQIVLVYAKDAYLFTVPEDMAMTKTSWESVGKEIAANRSMSRTPLTCRQGRWVIAVAS